MGREFSQESNEHRHGFFTLAVVEGLSGGAEQTPDGAIYLHKLDADVTDRVKELARGQQHPVTAKPGSSRSFPLARSTQGPTTPCNPAATGGQSEGSP
jgi:hypothetical protein